MPEFVLNRNYTLRTTAGHVVNFIKGNPTWVPPVITKEAVAIGAESLDAKVDVLEPEQEPKPELSLDEREQLIMLAFETLLEKNERESFTAQGIPTEKALKAATGLDVLTKERQDLWMKFREAKADEGK